MQYLQHFGYAKHAGLHKKCNFFLSPIKIGSTAESVLFSL